jgi:erythromycin esterase
MRRNLILPNSLALWLIFILILSGCGAPTLSAEEGKTYFQSIDTLVIPEKVTLVGLGEATHGNSEFVKIRQEVLALLVQKYGFRTLAIEGDFGGSQVVNDYVLNGNSTAVEVVKQIGFAIYRTQEMVDLVEWIRQYNLSVEPEQKIHFYGFDMQRYDNNKKGLLTFISKVDPGKVAVYQAAMSDLNDETVFNQSHDKIQTGLQAIKSIRADLNREKDRYIAASSQSEFNLADQYATCIEQNATLRGTDVNYSQSRDQYMAEKVKWILAYEQNQGRSRLLLAGHNGHIEKSAAAAQYRSMGSRLSEAYAKQYFTIGTDFYEGEFNSAESGSGERKQFSVKNHNPLNQSFENTGLNVAYLNIQKGIKNPVLKSLLTTQQPMTNIGDDFSVLSQFIEPFYTLKMIPAQAYDGIIFVNKATPTRLIK